MGAKPSFDSVSALMKELSPEEQDALVNSDNRPALKKFLYDPDRYTNNRFISPLLAADLIPDWFKVVEDVFPKEFKISDLKEVSFLDSRDRNDRVGGETMRQRAVKLKANLGLVDLKYVLSNSKEIPGELQFNSHCLVFAGTLLRGSGGYPCVACLRWNGKRWYTDFRSLSDGFCDKDRLASCK